MSGEASRRAVRIGLTGPIGCGKSTVAARLAAHGAVAIDADAVAREVSMPGTPVHKAIAQRFPAAVRGDGIVDRSALAAIVFAAPDELRALEAIVRPEVRPAILERMASADAAGASAVVVEAIGLVDSGLSSLCDIVVLVTCRSEDQRARLIARGATPDDAERRILAQTGLVARVRSAADPVVLDTTGEPARTERLVDELWGQLMAAAADRGGTTDR